MKLGLVIWDMDGTLVDSEPLAERVISRVSEMLDQPLSVEEVGQLFRGRNHEYMMAALTERNDGALPEQFEAALSALYFDTAKTELHATAHVHQAIEELMPTPMCVASNGEPSSIEKTLGHTDLIKYFGTNLFSARHVKEPKPAPDLFLHAARTMNVAVDQCVVIEDTALGVEAANSAGMHVIGFSGNHADRVQTFDGLDVPVSSDMREIPKLVRSLFS